MQQLSDFICWYRLLGHRDFLPPYGEFRTWRIGALKSVFSSAQLVSALKGSASARPLIKGIGRCRGYQYLGSLQLFCSWNTASHLSCCHSLRPARFGSVSYTHLRAHENVL